MDLGSFNKLFEHRGDTARGGDAEAVTLRFRVARRGATRALLPVDRRRALEALAEIDPSPGIGGRLFRAMFALGLDLGLKRIELRVSTSGSFAQFFTDELGVPGLASRELAVWLEDGQDERFRFLQFDTLHRRAVDGEAGLGVAAQLVAEDCPAEGKSYTDGEEFSAYGHLTPPTAPTAERRGSLRRFMEQSWTRLMFFRQFYKVKKAQVMGHGTRWVRPGIEPTPLPDKIDVIYLWRDESDPAWLERRADYLRSRQDERGFNLADLDPHATQTSLDRLRYSLRSLEKYFEPIGNIFIITDRQRPDWLSDDPRVRIVDHTEIFRDSEHLPSYNSQAIESHMHRIEGLSEFFVYLNDDFFLNSAIGVRDLFTEGGKIRVRLGRAVTKRGTPHEDEGGDTSGQKNANRVLDRRFKREPRLTVMHRPYAHRKSLLERAELEFPEEFLLTRRSQFRSVEMYALHNLLVPYWAHYIGEGELVPPQLFRKDMFYWANDPKHNANVLERIHQFEQISFCIQTDLSTYLTEESVASYRAAMETVFPKKSSFEI